MNTGSIYEQEELEKILVSTFKPKVQKVLTPQKKRKKKIIVLTGPTACGKTELSLHLCRAIKGEVISADSMQVYRGMDIGTAKANTNQRRMVPHHLLDIRDIKEEFNAVDYYYEARHCCENLCAYDTVPVVVGGSGFYIHTLLYGPPKGPPSVPKVRKALETEANHLGIEALYERLQLQDRKYAETLTPRDSQKIIRALEIITLSGLPVSNLSWNNRNTSMNYDFRCWFIHRSRESLYKRVEERCDEMLSQGFLEEVKKLDQQGDIRKNRSTNRSIGYRQALAYLDSEQTKEDYARFSHDFKKCSRRYIKRQFTWARQKTNFKWLDLELHDFETAVDIIVQDYKRH